MHSLPAGARTECRNCVLAAASELDTSNPRRTQRLSGRSQRCPGGDDIVDDEHAETVARTPGTKRGAGEAVGTGLAGLRTSMSPVQQPTAGNAQLTGDRTGDDLGLVVAPGANAASAGRRPGHHIDRGETEPTHHLSGEYPGGRTAVAELQGDDQLPGHTIERKCSADAVGAPNRADRGQREPAAMAQCLARGSASRATHPESIPKCIPESIMVQSIPGGCHTVVGKVSAWCRCCFPIDPRSG